MKKHELLIVGGSAGGIQAAICAQKHHGLKDIVVIRPEVKAMVPCGIPYIYGTLGGVEKNILPDKLLGEAKLKVGEVVSIDRKSKTVTLKDGEVLGYNKLILAIGSNPVQPPIPGIDRKNVWFVRKHPDYLQELASAMDDARHVVVIGGGFIGVEFADEVRKRGQEVTIVELLQHCLQLVCTEELCIRAEEALKERGVKVITSNAVKSIGGNDKVEFLRLESGEEIKCDMVIIGIGVVPNTRLAEEAGLRLVPPAASRLMNSRGLQIVTFSLLAIVPKSIPSSTVSWFLCGLPRWRRARGRLLRLTFTYPSGETSVPWVFSQQSSDKQPSLWLASPMLKHIS